MNKKTPLITEAGDRCLHIPPKKHSNAPDKYRVDFILHDGTRINDDMEFLTIKEAYEYGDSESRSSTFCREKFSAAKRFEIIHVVELDEVTSVEECVYE